MHPDLKTLIELQELDNSVSVLTARIESSPLEIQALKDQLGEFIRIHDERKSRLATNQKERRTLDAEVQAIRAKIEKHKEQLYQVKTNEQYRAMQKEVEGEEANVRKVEDQILEKMVEAEQIEKLIREAESRLAGEKDRVAADIQHIEASRQQNETERKTLLDRREGLTSSLKYEVLAHYDRLRRGRHGIALAEVRDGFCGGCHVLLRPQAYNEIRSSDVYMTCEACARILYYLPPAPDDAATADVQAAPRAAAQS